MSQPSEAQPAPQPTPAPAPKGGRGKLIAIIVAVIVILVAIAVAVVYVLNQTPPLVAGTIKVGFTISETGTFNVEGGNSLNGIKTAQSWINSNGGIIVGNTRYNISLDYYDDQSSSTQVAALYPKIVQQDGAQFLLAPYSTGLTTAAAPFADQFNEVMLSHGGAADTIWQQGYKNLVEVLSPASGYLKSGLDWLHANHPTDKLAFLYASDSFSTLSAQSAITYAQGLGFNVVYNASYPGTATDLSTQLNAAKSAGATDLLGGGHYNDGLLIMNNLKSIGWKPSFVSLLVAVTETTFGSSLGAAANNITGPSQWETTVAYSPSLASTDGIPWFGPTPAQFTSLYGNVTGGKTPTYHSGEAGAALILLADAIKTAGSLNTTAVRNALGGMHIMTFFGQFQVNSAGLQIAHTMVLDQWQAGVLKVVYPANVAVASVQYPYTGS